MPQRLRPTPGAKASLAMISKTAQIAKAIGSLKKAPGKK